MATIVRKNVKTPESLSELRDSLCQLYADVSNDRAMVAQADAAANVAGKIINITAMEIEAYKLSGRTGKLNTRFLLANEAKQ